MNPRGCSSSPDPEETPISRPVSSEQANSGGVSRQFLINHYFPTAVLEHTRFFDTWLRRIAPDTHQDQASGDETACRPGGFAAPEERWCRCVSKGCFTFAWLPISWRQSVSGSRSGRSVSLQIGGGDTASNSFAMARAPVSCFGLPAAVITQAKQRVTSNGLRSFNMWKYARASLCASALIATTLLVLDFFRS